MSEVKKLELEAWLDGLRGCGSELILEVRGRRKKRTGEYEFYNLELNFSRYSVRQLMGLIRSMHIRDRERIANEQKRIEHELQAVQL